MSRKVRIALIGCGAVARRFYLPVLSGHPGVELAVLVDTDRGRLNELASGYGVAARYQDFRQVSRDSAEAAVVCTPPGHHAEIALELLQRGIHVLVEKPMATSLEAAEAMVAMAERGGVVLAVALFTRLLPSSRLLRATLESGWLGRPIGFDVRYGRAYGWPAATLGSMQRALAGGGVLIDSGIHVIDQLAYFFGDEPKVLSYRDNARGGVESDCKLELAFERGGPLTGTVELSRTRLLRNSCEVECERGKIVLTLEERGRLKIVPSAFSLRDPVSSAPRPYDLELAWQGQPDVPWHEAFRLEIDDFLDAIRERREPELRAREALSSMRVVADCYRRVEPLVEPGMEPPAPRISASASPRRVLISGATGFLGCRAAELLSLRHGWQVRAAVHTPANASRVARLPVELVLADVRSRGDVERLVQGCDAIVHCAIGTQGSARAARQVTVEGTQHLCEAALSAGVRRFVHISSIAAYGLSPGMELDESMLLRPARGDDYAESKAASERAVLAAVERGLSATILRPTRIYGPFSELFIVRPLSDLRRGAFSISQSAVGAPSQMVFVDNVVAAIGAALEAPTDAIAGQAFNIGDADQMSCDDFYRFFADAMGTKLPIVDGGARTNTGALERGLRRLRRTLARVKNTKEGSLLAERVAALRKRRAPTPYRRPEAALQPGEIIQPREAAIDLGKAERVLGHRQVVTTAAALDLTLRWARYAGLVP